MSIFTKPTVDSIMAAHNKTITALTEFEAASRTQAANIDAEIEAMTVTRNAAVAEGIRAAAIAEKMRSVLS